MSAHGGDIYDAEGRAGKLLDFSSSIHPFGPSSAVRAFLEGGDGTLWTIASRYPDPCSRALKRTILAYERALSGAEPEERSLLVVSGASELIQTLAMSRAFSRAFLCAPLFGGYRRAFAAAGMEIVLPESAAQSSPHGGRAKAFRALPDDICEQIDRFGTGLVVLCNPGNPTGLTVNRELLDEVLLHCEGTGATLLVDECFLEFLPDAGERTLVPRIAAGCGRLIVLRALTKRFALPGLRVGYAYVGDGMLAGRLAACLPEWNLSGIAQEAGRLALTDALDPGCRDREIARVAAERDFLVGELEKRGLEVVPGRANYLLFSGPAGLEAALFPRGILIRACGDYEGMPAGAWYRTAVRTRGENRILLAALDGILSES